MPEIFTRWYRDWRSGAAGRKPGSNGEPDSPGGCDTDEFESLPLDTLDEDIEISDPLTDEELDTLFELWDSDEPLCGEGPFPDCEEASWLLGGDSCPLDEIGTPDCGEDAWDESWGDAGFGDINYEDAFYDDTGDTQDTTDEYYDDSGDTQDNSDEYYDDSGDTGDISDDSGAGDNSGDEYYDDGGSDTGDSGDSGE
ncbi:MAG: hypothetical protein H6672_20400 [Anaerolineaceae bacterium]|nr:hypothetical protein [Anaerolineaceae bacterium]